jgi:hypothetical protein
MCSPAMQRACQLLVLTSLHRASWVCCCVLQFAGAKAEYNAKHEVYFRLHQEIQAHQRDLSGLRRAAQLAASPTEAKRWEDQVL